MSTLLCARAASAQLPAEVQRKTSRPLGTNTLTQFAHPAQPVQKKSRPVRTNTPARFVSPAESVQGKNAEETLCVSH